MSSPGKSPSRLQAEFKVDDAEVETALSGILRDSLTPVTLGLGILYALLTVGHLLVLPAGIKFLMAGVATGTALLFLGFYLYVRKHTIPLAWANPLGLVIVGLILFNSLLHLWLTSDPLQTTNVILLVIGAGLLFLSSKWLILSYGLSLGGWLLVALMSPPHPSWIHFGFAVVIGMTVSALAFSARRSSLVRLERLRIRDRLQQAELQRRAIELETSIGVGQKIISLLDINSLLHAIVHFIKEQYGFSFVGIFLLDAASDSLVIRAASGQNADELMKRGWAIKKDANSIIGWTATQRQPYFASDVRNDPHYLQNEWSPNTRTELALPLLMGDSLLGVLDIQCERLEVLSAKNIPVMELLASQVAIALQNASLYQSEARRRSQAEILYDVAHAISRTLDFSEVLNLILQELVKIVPYDRAAVLLREDNALQAVASRGFPLQITLQDLRIDGDDIFDQIDHSHCPLLLEDVSQRQTWQNLTGVPVARSWVGIPLIQQDTVIGLLSLAREQGEPFSEEEIKLATTLGGQAAVALTNTRLYHNLLVFNETLEQIVAERTQALQQAYSELERIDRAKTDFIEIIAHELRTPLTILHGYAQMLMQDQAIQAMPHQKQLASGIYTGAERLHEIVNSMLDVLKVEVISKELNPQPVDLSILARQLVKSLSTALEERHIQLTMTWEKPHLTVMGDSEMLYKALNHLVINAIKYTPDGGKVWIEGRNVPAAQSRLGQDAIEISIHDTGIGIAPEEQEAIFLKFYQTGKVSLHSSGKTKFKAGGAGLGLAIVKGIVKAHKGVIWVESPGYDEKSCPGSHFYIQLPA